MLDDRADGRRHCLLVAQDREFELIGIVEVLPSRSGWRERVDDGAHRLVRQKTVDDDMGKGLCRRERRSEAVGEGLELLATGKRLDHLCNLLGP